MNEGIILRAGPIIDFFGIRKIKGITAIWFYNFTFISLSLLNFDEGAKEMIRIELNEQEKKRLKLERYEHPDPDVQKRASALHAIGLGYGRAEACKLAGISSTTLTRCLKQYLEDGLDAVLRGRQYESGGELDQYRDGIEKHFKKNPPATVKAACAAIKKLTGVERKETQVRKFLHRIGMKPRKVGGVPGKADLEKQEDFKKKVSSQS